MRLVVLFLFLGNAVYAQSSMITKADSLFVNGNFSKAIAIYKTQTNQEEVYHKMARSYVAIGNYDKALEYYQLSVTSQPKEALVLYEYAKLLSKTKKYEAAIEVFHQLMNIDYRNPNYHYEMGLAMERMNDSTAMNRFRAAYDLDNSHQKAIFKIAKHYLIKRKHDISLKYIDQGLENYKNNLELISLKAQNYYYLNDYKNARLWFQKLLDLGESSEFIHEKLSLIHAEFSDYELAIEQRKKALAFNPYDANAMFVIGTYYNSLQDFVNAEKYMKQALALKDVPLDFEYQKLGIVLNQQKKHKEALAAFQTSLDENSENVGSAFFMVVTKDKYYEDIDTKIQLYQDFKEKFPDSFYSKFSERRISELKEEKFMKDKE
ncbi:MAG: tetratricopeptide repeat protein [Algicola sp.]|nr:tetratricopeptide repeat protein [Algicola sp.]